MALFKLPKRTDANIDNVLDKVATEEAPKIKLKGTSLLSKIEMIRQTVEKNLGSEKGNYLAKLICGIILLIALFSILQMICLTYNADMKILEYFTDSAEKRYAGGLVGGIFTKILCSLIGVVGAYIVDVVLIIIMVVIITEKSFIGGVKKGSTKVYN